MRTGSARQQPDPLRAALALTGTEADIAILARSLCELAICSTDACGALISVRDNASCDLLVLYPTSDPTQLADHGKVELVEGSPAQLATSQRRTLMGDRASVEHTIAALLPAEATVFLHCPLVCGGECIGLLIAAFEELGSAQAASQTLDELATLAAPCLGYRTTTALTRSRIKNTQSAMLGIARIGPVAAQEDAREACVAAGRKMLGTDMVALFTIDPYTGGVECASADAVDEELRSAFWELFGRRVTDRNDECVWVVHDVETETRGADRAKAVLLERGIRSILACPVRSNTGASGVLAVLHRCRLTHTDDQVTLVSTVAAVATAVISYAHAVEQSTCLLDDLAGANQELSVQAAHDGLTNLPNHRAFQQSLSEMCRRSTATRRPFSLVMIDVDHFKLYNDSYGHQDGDSALRDVATVISAGLRQEDVAARYGGEEFAVALSDVPRDRARQVAERIRLAIASHTFVSGRLTISLGVAEFPADGNIPSELIEHADRALYHAKSTGRNRVVVWGAQMEREDVPEHVTETRAGMSDQAIEALMAAVAAKDPITALHSERVAALSLALADCLGIKGAERRALAVAARLHDIGKLSLPDSALNKLTPLTEDEWRAVKEHPVTGSKIVGAITELSYVSNIVRHHHERLDGTGYPDGLSDEAIPFLAKLIAVVDTYQAMTEARAYRAAIDPIEALRELQEHAGTYYDPAIVDALQSYLASVEGVETDTRRAA